MSNKLGARANKLGARKSTIIEAKLKPHVLLVHYGFNFTSSIALYRTHGNACGLLFIGGGNGK